VLKRGTVLATSNGFSDSPSSFAVDNSLSSINGGSLRLFCFSRLLVQLRITPVAAPSKCRRFLGQERLPAGSARPEARFRGSTEHGNVPVVTDDKRRTYGGLPLVRDGESETLAKLRPAFYGRPEVQRFLETVVVIKN
jgi:hypothetical protein